MTDINQERILELAKLPENSVCAECTAQGVDWASYTLGVFLCSGCAALHRSLDLSRVKSLRQDRWDSEQVSALESLGGNSAASARFLLHVPLCYRRPRPHDPPVLKEQWIRAKYEREEFIYEDRQVYTSGTLDGWLYKKGKKHNRFHLRKFVLCALTNTLKYYIKEHHKEPKATIAVSELNATFCPAKIGSSNGLQLTFLKDGSTRNIFVYSSEGKEIVEWYMGIRAAKLHWLQVAFPSSSAEELARGLLTRDFLREGWLWKSGPSVSDAPRRRWFCLDHRRLMYLEHPLDAYPKGEIFVGHHSEGYGVAEGVPAGVKVPGLGFSLRTPQRLFALACSQDEDRAGWISVLRGLTERPLSLQDHSMAVNLVRKRTVFNSPLHIFNVV